VSAALASKAIPSTKIPSLSTPTIATASSKRQPVNSRRDFPSLLKLTKLQMTLAVRI